MTQEIVKQLWHASSERKVCRISLKKEPLPRLIHPYGVCKTSANKIVLVCKQVTGFTKAGGKAGYRNLILDKVQEVEVTDQKFPLPEDFDPDDGQYKEWVYHVLQNE